MHQPYLDGFTGEDVLLESEKGALTYSQFGEAVKEKANALPLRNDSDYAPFVFLREDDPYDFFPGLFAAWTAGRVPVPVPPSLPKPALEIWKSRLSELREGRPPCLVQFTSGTSGIPKGVLLSFAKLWNNARLSAEALELSDSTRLFVNTPPFFTSGLIHFLSVLAVRGTFLYRSKLIFGSDLGEALNRSKANAFGGAPIHLVRVLESGVDLPEIKTWITSGDHLPKEIARRALNYYPQMTLYNLYGLTEVAGRLCFLNLRRFPHKIGFVGKPLPGMSIHILDPSGKQVVAGESGELFVDGPLRFTEYVGDAVRTAEALTPWGFRTGDFGYRDAEGCLFLEGRKDDVFKSGAEKVSRVQIENALLETGLCREVAVVAICDVFLGTVPAAYVVPFCESAFQKRDLLKSLRGVLPASHIPKRIHVVERLPRTGSGKLVVRELAQSEVTE